MRLGERAVVECDHHDATACIAYGDSFTDDNGYGVRFALKLIAFSKPSITVEGGRAVITHDDDDDDDDIDLE
jgi:hypothetical protein